MLEVSVQPIARQKGFRNASELQRAAGLNYPQAARYWQGGAMKMIDLPALEKLAQALHCSARDFFIETGEVGTAPAPAKAGAALPDWTRS